MAKTITLPPLDETTNAELEQRYNETTDAETRLRYQMVHLARQGFSMNHIAQLVLRSRNTVARVLYRFVSQGLSGVPKRTAPGRHPTVNAGRPR